MAETDRNSTRSFTFYTYVYGDDPSQSARRYYETEAKARRDLLAFRSRLIGERDRREPLRDMSIVRLQTIPVTGSALVAFFNDLDGKLGGFIRSREVVAVVTEPQVTLGV